MSLSEIVAGARAEGLQDPRVVPYRRKTGEVAYKLYFGPLGDRRDHVIEAGTTPDDLRTILMGLRQAAA